MTLAVVLAACADADGESAPRTEVVLQVEQAAVRGSLEALTLRIEQVVFTGLGPDGPESVALEVGEELGGDAATEDWGTSEGVPLEMSLALGGWRQVLVSVHLQTRDDQPALFSSGVRADGGRFEVSLLALSFEGGRDVFELDEGSQFSLVLDPRAWTLPDEGGLPADEDGTVRLDVSDTTGAYETFVHEVRSSTRLNVPELGE